jgi:hypothetical protein
MLMREYNFKMRSKNGCELIKPPEKWKLTPKIKLFNPKIVRPRMAEIMPPQKVLNPK